MWAFFSCTCSSCSLNKWFNKIVERKKIQKCSFNCASNWSFDFCWKTLTVHFKDKTCFHFIMQTKNTKFSLSSDEPFCFHRWVRSLRVILKPTGRNFIMCCFYNLQYLHIFCFLYFCSLQCQLSMDPDLITPTSTVIVWNTGPASWSENNI